MLTHPARADSAKRRPRARSRVKTLVRRPYAEPSTICERLRLAVDGGDRDDRPEGLLAGDLHALRDPIEDRRLEEQRAPQARARVDRRACSVAPRSMASPTWRSVLAAVRSLLSGPIVVAPSSGSPSRTSALDGLDEEAQVGIVDGPVDEHPLARGAALAGVEEAGRDRRPHGGVQVGVVEDHERPVAAHLEEQLLTCCPLGDPRAGLRRPDESDRGDPRVCRRSRRPPRRPLP